MGSMQCNMDLGTNSAFALGRRKTLIELAGRRTFRMQTDSTTPVTRMGESKVEALVALPLQKDLPVPTVLEAGVGTCARLRGSEEERLL
jgi:hypothetical protein